MSTLPVILWYAGFYAILAAVAVMLGLATRNLLCTYVPRLARLCG